MENVSEEWDVLLAGFDTGYLFDQPPASSPAGLLLLALKPQALCSSLLAWWLITYAAIKASSLKKASISASVIVVSLVSTFILLARSLK